MYGSARSLSSSENVYVLFGILGVTLLYGLFSVTQRRSQDRQAAERKRRLLGIPEPAPVPNLSARRTAESLKSHIYAWYKACVVALALRTQGSLGSGAGTPATSKNATATESGTSAQSPQKKTRATRAASGLGPPAAGNPASLRNSRGRARGDTGQSGPSQASSSTSPASRKSSRSVSTHTANAELASRKDNQIPNKPKSRSIAVQYPSDDEEHAQVVDRGIQASPEAMQSSIGDATGMPITRGFARELLNRAANSCYINTSASGKQAKCSGNTVPICRPGRESCRSRRSEA